MSTYWKQTYTGKVFDYVDTTVESICLEDIAHSLSLQCRFSGHCKRFYSVAEHSVYVAHETQRLAGSTEYGILPFKVGVLHDAAEAYIGDIVSPLKALIRDAIKPLEQKIETLVWARFNIDEMEVRKMAKFVKRADWALLRTEADALLGPAPKLWDFPEDCVAAETDIIGMSPPLAEIFFLKACRAYVVTDCRRCHAGYCGQHGVM